MDVDFSPAVERLQNMVTDFITLLPNFGVAVLVFIVFYFLSAGAGALVEGLSIKYKRHQNLGYVLGRLAQWFVALLGFLIALVIAFPNFSPAQMIQLLGISGIAIGFAFRDILENFLAGILLLISNAFNIGDQVLVEGVEGTVEDIQTRATAIRTYDGRRVIMPNAKLFTNIVTVNTAFENRRIQQVVGIGYEDDIEQAKRLILDALYEVDDVIVDPPADVLLVELAEYSVNLCVRWWIKPPLRRDALDTQDRVLLSIKKKLDENGISMPFPTYQVLMVNPDGSRVQKRVEWSG